jgi:hypothetical protein
MRTKRPSAALVIACIALFVALGGGAYAVKSSKVKLKNNSVTTKKIRDGAVTGPKLAGNAVDGSKIANGSVDESKIAKITFQSAGAGTAQFGKDALGFVHLRGIVSSISNGTSMFTLPAGFRPQLDQAFPAICGFSTNGEVEVGTDGKVTPFGSSCNSLFIDVSSASFFAG